MVVIACGDLCCSGPSVAPDPQLGTPFLGWCGHGNTASPVDTEPSAVVPRLVPLKLVDSVFEGDLVSFIGISSHPWDSVIDVGREDHL
jgi:hypothetical protein